MTFWRLWGLWGLAAVSAVACADAATPGGGASLRITNLSDGRQAAGQFEVRWDVSGIDGSNRVRMTARLVGEGEQGACGERLGGGGSVEFDVSGCADFAPGRAFVLRVEALDAGDTPFRRPVFEEVSLIVAGATKGTLYEPNPTANADDNASYPHAIEIRHGGDANGTILATFERQLLFSNDPGRGWLLFRSTDGGATFERIGAPIEPANHPNATVALQPCLLELATETGGFAAGTLYLAGATIDDTQFELQLFRSIDGGATFEFVSTIDLGDTKLDPRRPWEPYLLQLEDGRLVAYYSDELTPGGRQNIVRRVSSDGGATWGDKVDVWRSLADGDRPGMVTVARMGDGRYAMAVEMCGAPGDYCRAHIKTSTDGLEWGSSAADLGSRPVSTTNHPFHGNPAIAWTPKGGPKGTLILSARDLQENLFTPDMRAGNHGQTLLVNHEYGEGPWYELTAAVPWVAGTDNTQAGYRNFALPLGSGDALLYFAATYTGEGNRNRMLFATTNPGILPFADPFAGGVDVGFQRFGGDFIVEDGVYVDRAAGLGDKAITGSTAWTDTTTSVDVRIDGAGNAGLLVRVTNPSVGADAYDGYYVGLSATEGTAFVGRARHDFSLLGTERLIPGGVVVGAWYGIRVKATGCQFDVEVTPPSGAPTAFSETDPGCTQIFGAAGVRTFGTTAAWRSFRVIAE